MQNTHRSWLRRPLVLAVAAVLTIAVLVVTVYKLLYDPTVVINLGFDHGRDLALAADGGTLGLRNNSSGLELYSLPAYKRVSKIGLPFGPQGPPVMAWKADLSQVALSAGTGTSVEIRDTRSGAVVRSLHSDAPGAIVFDQGPTWTGSTPAPMAIEALAWSPDGRYLAIERYSGAIGIWDLQTDRSTSITFNANRMLSCLAWSADSGMLAFSNAPAGQLVIYAAPDFAAPIKLDSEKYCSEAAWHANGKLLAQSIEVLGHPTDRRVEVWDAGTQTRVAVSPTPAFALAWHPTEQVLAMLAEGGVELWRPYDDTVVVLEGLGRAAVSQVAFTPDGRDILIATDDGRVRAWSLAERAPSMFK